MGLKLLRRWLLRSAEGDVLEVSTGTGRNLRYYHNVRSLTLTDASREMLLQAWDKYSNDGSQRRGNYFPVTIARVNVERLTRDRSFDAIRRSNDGQEEDEVWKGSDDTGVHEEALRPLSDKEIDRISTIDVQQRRPDITRMRAIAEGEYDTVVDTFGLCSCDDPVQALKVSPIEKAKRKSRATIN